MGDAMDLLEELDGVFREDPRQVQEFLGFGRKAAEAPAADAAKVEALRREVEADLKALAPGFDQAHRALQGLNVKLFRPTLEVKKKAEELARIAEGTKFDASALVKEATFLHEAAKAFWTLADAIHDSCNPAAGEHGTTDCVREPRMKVG